MTKPRAVSKVKEIQEAIRNLPAKQRSRLARWLRDLDEEEWDEQIAKNATSGKLKKLANEVDRDIEAGEELATNQAYDTAKASRQKPISFEDAVRRIERRRGKSKKEGSQ